MISSPSASAAGLLEGAVVRPGRTQAAGLPQQADPGQAAPAPVRFTDLVAGALLPAAAGPAPTVTDGELVAAGNDTPPDGGAEELITVPTGQSASGQPLSPFETAPSQGELPGPARDGATSQQPDRSASRPNGTPLLTPPRGDAPNGVGPQASAEPPANGVRTPRDVGSGVRPQGPVGAPGEGARPPEPMTPAPHDPAHAEPPVAPRGPVARVEGWGSERDPAAPLGTPPLRRIITMEPVGSVARPAKGTGPALPLTAQTRGGPAADPSPEALAGSPTVPGAEGLADEARMAEPGTIQIPPLGDHTGPVAAPDAAGVAIRPSDPIPGPHPTPSTPEAPPVGTPDGSSPEKPLLGETGVLLETPDAGPGRAEVPGATVRGEPSRPGLVIGLGVQDRGPPPESDGVRTPPPSPAASTRGEVILTNPERSGPPVEGAPGLIRAQARSGGSPVSADRAWSAAPIRGGAPQALTPPGIEPDLSTSRTGPLPAQPRAGADVGPLPSITPQASPATPTGPRLSGPPAQGPVPIRTGVATQVPARPVSAVASGSGPTEVAADEPREPPATGLARGTPDGFAPLAPTAGAPQAAAPGRMTGGQRTEGQVAAPGRSAPSRFGAPVPDPVLHGRADPLLSPRAEPTSSPGATQTAPAPVGLTPDPVSMSASTLLSDRVALARHVGPQISPSGLTEGRTQITLRPDGLGAVEIELKTDPSGRLSVLLRVENPTVLQALREDRNALLMGLEQSGLDLDGPGLSFESFGGDAERGSEREGRSASASPRDPEPQTAAPPPKRHRYAPLVGGGRIDILT